MPFTVAGFNTELLADNPTYERFRESDLHALVTMLRSTPPGWTATQLASEMKKISATKWQKYARTRRYLEREITALTPLLRAIPTGFTTVAMKSVSPSMASPRLFAPQQTRASGETVWR